jgi:hypothetical protein
VAERLKLSERIAEQDPHWLAAAVAELSLRPYSRRH